MSGSESDNEQVHHRKKGVRNVDEYVKERRKRARSLGKEYITSKGLVVPAKRPGPSCK